MPKGSDDENEMSSKRSHGTTAGLGMLGENSDTQHNSDGETRGPDENDVREPSTKRLKPSSESDGNSKTPWIDRTSFSSHPSLECIRQIQSQFCEERNWVQYHTPRNILLAMVGEVGEVSELFQWRGEVKEGLPDWTEEEKTHLGHELSDVLVYLVRLADRCHIDLPAAVMEKFDLNRKKYPADKVYGSSKKYTEYKNKKNPD